MSKVELGNLLTLAKSDRERELVRYAAFKASGFTASEARLHYGFENMTKRAEEVEACIQESLHIRESINSLCEDEEQSAIQLFGIGSETTDTDSSNDCGDRLVANSCYINEEELISLIRASQFNWFEVVDTVVSAMYVMMKKKQ